MIDRLPEGADLGYALALWPHGTRVLHALGVYDAFKAESEPMLTYVLRDGAERRVGNFSFQAMLQQFGHLGIISRPDFVALLERSLGGLEVRRGVSVESLRVAGDEVEVRLTDGVEASFDLVIGADGIHSRVRELLWGRLPENDTGWGCYAWWADKTLAAQGEVIERWGVGSFLGVYPCRDRLGVIVGAPVGLLQPDQPQGRTGRIRALLAVHDVPVDKLLAGLPGDSQPLFLWRMSDVRAPTWVQGRVALVGDAAVAFLPTAGVGASMALESAAVLADELSRTDAGHLPNALDLYVKRRRRRVEAAQDESRWLGRFVFVRSRPLGFLRDRLLRLTSMERAIGPLVKQLTEPL